MSPLLSLLSASSAPTAATPQLDTSAPGAITSRTAPSGKQPARSEDMGVWMGMGWVCPQPGALVPSPRRGRRPLAPPAWPGPAHDGLFPARGAQRAAREQVLPSKTRSRAKRIGARLSESSGALVQLLPPLERPAGHPTCPRLDRRLPTARRRLSAASPNAAPLARLHPGRDAGGARREGEAGAPSVGAYPPQAWLRPSSRRRLLLPGALAAACRARPLRPQGDQRGGAVLLHLAAAAAAADDPRIIRGAEVAGLLTERALMSPAVQVRSALRVIGFNPMFATGIRLRLVGFLLAITYPCAWSWRMLRALTTSPPRPNSVFARLHFYGRSDKGQSDQKVRKAGGKGPGGGGGGKGKDDFRMLVLMLAKLVMTGARQIAALESAVYESYFCAESSGADIGTVARGASMEEDRVSTMMKEKQNNGETVDFRERGAPYVAVFVTMIRHVMVMTQVDGPHADAAVHGPVRK
ncbi:unnamed protein product [Prorocentrum cordatum]|uniref:Protein RFT1 homolog n=1 Tax=Prorocentrum cordatum TaxID=2364126 RepID=A0ABN9PUT8_9DINO|nr:unnamed protein product [Polarella glacialis]